LLVPNANILPRYQSVRTLIKAEPAHANTPPMRHLGDKLTKMGDHDCVRRRLLQAGIAAPLSAGLALVAHPAATAGARIRPTDAAWPAPEAWKELEAQLSGPLIAVRSPWPECMRSPLAPACSELFRQAKNPYFLGDEVALTQTLGWVDAWTSAPSVYAVRAHNPADVVSAVNFARARNLRLVVKGGGQLPGHLECARFPAGVDARHEGNHPA
jgi:hypothetical protein